MRTLVWVMLSWVGTVLLGALFSRMPAGHLVPDLALIVVLFRALRTDPIPTAWTALLCGYGIGRQALAPLGMHEVGLVCHGVVVYVLAGHLSGSGRGFFAMLCGAATITYHALLALLALWVRDRVGFASMGAAALVPAAILNIVLGWLIYPRLLALQGLLHTERREGLPWHS